MRKKDFKKIEDFLKKRNLEGHNSEFEINLKNGLCIFCNRFVVIDWEACLYFFNNKIGTINLKEVKSVRIRKESNLIAFFKENASWLFEF